jgi:tRNA (uracil-5-)-methyltransferase TRM9
MYSKIAHEFSKTRTRPWRCVETFLSSHPASTLLDAGCGNGRNLIAATRAGFDAEGFDICPEFVEICRARELKVYVGNIESPKNPITKTYDAILCIAVLHHLRGTESRQTSLQRMYDALNPDGSLLLTVWSYESQGARFPKEFQVGDNIVPWKSRKDSQSDRYYYIYDRVHLDAFLETFRLSNPSARIEVSWEEQNWNIEIHK